MLSHAEDQERFNWLQYFLGVAVFFLVSHLYYYIVDEITPFFLILHVGIALLLFQKKTLHHILIGYLMAVPAVLLFIALLLIEMVIHPPSEE